MAMLPLEPLEEASAEIRLIEPELLERPEPLEIAT